MPILHRVSEQPQSINQPGGKETDIMCVCVCVSAHVQHRAIQVYYCSAIFERGALISQDAIINVSRGLCLKEEGGRSAADTRGRGGVQPSTQAAC